MDLWRISKYHSLGGEGGQLYAARWNTIGHPVVYLAGSPTGALVEVLVHLELDDDDIPPHYTLLRVSVPDQMRIVDLDVPAGEAWKSNEPLTRKLGDTWLESQRSALARVPSAIVPETWNFLLNPLHPDAAKIKIATTSKGTFDPRLFRAKPTP